MGRNAQHVNDRAKGRSNTVRELSPYKISIKISDDANYSTVEGGEGDKVWGRSHGENH